MSFSFSHASSVVEITRFVAQKFFWCFSRKEKYDNRIFGGGIPLFYDVLQFLPKKGLKREREKKKHELMLRKKGAACFIVFRKNSVV